MERLGFEGKLYFCAAGIGGNPIFTEATTLRNVTHNDSLGEHDTTSRASGGFKTTGVNLFEISFDGELAVNTDDPTYVAFRTAYYARQPIGIAVMSGPITTPGVEGTYVDCVITQFNRDQQLTDGQVVKVSFKPAATANTPRRVTVGA